MKGVEGIAKSGGAESEAAGSEAAGGKAAGGEAVGGEAVEKPAPPAARREPTFIDFLKSLVARRPPRAVHRLKWPWPEVRISAAVDDAEEFVPRLKRAGAVFVGGGEFVDSVYVKEFAEGVYAYFIIRVDKRTEEESVLFIGYMLEEEERLGVELESRYVFARNLEALGYSLAFSREVVVWSFNYVGLPLSLYSVSGFGDFLEVVLPSTKEPKRRERDEKSLEKLLDKLGIAKDVTLPTDVTTLQFLATRGREGEKR